MDENTYNITTGETGGSSVTENPASSYNYSGGGLFTASPGEGMNNYSETASGSGLLTQSIMNNSDKTGVSAYPPEFSQSHPGLFMSDNELIKPDPEVLPEPQAMPSYDNSTLGKFSDAGIKENLSLLNAGVQPDNSSTGFPGLSPESASIFRNPLCDSKDNMVYVTRDGKNECYQIDSFLNNLLNSSREHIYAFEYCFNNINEDKLRQSKSNENAEKYFPMKTDIYKYAGGNLVNIYDTKAAMTTTWPEAIPLNPSLPVAVTSIINPFTLAVMIGAGIILWPSSIAEDETYETDKSKHCDNIYNKVDIPTCRAISSKRAKRSAARCYKSAADRYAACLTGKPMPPLDTWNN